MEESAYRIVLVAGSVAVAVLYLAFILLRFRILDRPFRSLEIRRFFPVAVAATATILGMATVLFETSGRSLFRSRAEVLSVEFRVLAERMEDLTRRTKKLEESFVQVPPPTDGGKPTTAARPAEIAQLQRGLVETQSAVKKFEELLMTDAEKVVTLPLLKGDLRALDNQIAALKQQVTSQTLLLQETQAQNRWIIGTLGLGLLALIVPVVRAAFPSKSDKSNAPT